MRFKNTIDLDSAFERVHGLRHSAADIIYPKEKNTQIPAFQKQEGKAGSPRFGTTDSADWQFDPVDFKTFCESSDHMNLLPKGWKPGDEGALSKRQFDDCMAILGDEPKKFFDPKTRKYTFGGLLWSKGCVHKDTKIFDEITKKTYTVEQLVKDKRSIHIKSYNEKTKKVVIKPVARIFSKGISKRICITFKSGRKIIVGEAHKFYDGLSWIAASDCTIGTKLCFLDVNYYSNEEFLSTDVISNMIKLPDGEIFDLTIDEETPNYFTADGLLHHNSGKDYVCSIIQAYAVHIMLCLRNPQEFFGFPPGEPCDILNVGQKGLQAERVYFSKFKARILGWKWLKERYNIIDSGRRSNFIDRKHPTCEIGKREVIWKDKIIRAFAENSGNPQALDGYNIIFYLCDEISGWLSDAERKTVNDIMTILRSSQGSRNTKSLKGIGLAISYPRSDDDIMFEIEKESLQKNSKTFFSRAYQWQVKPKRCYSGETFKFNAGTEEQPEWFNDLPVELDEDFFKKHPDKAKCFYLLKPPPVGGQFFEMLEKADSVMYEDRIPLFKIATEIIDAVDGSGHKIQYLRKRIIGMNRQPNLNVDYVAWLDAADTTCDAVLSFGHKELVTIIEGNNRQEVACVVIDDTIVWEPNKEKRLIVDINSMTVACLESRKYITLKSAWWDQWNSGTGMMDFRNANILADKHNLTLEDYEFFRDALYTNRVIAPKSPETIKGIGQLKHLSRTRTNVVPGSSQHKKDIADTWCGVTSLLIGHLSNTANFRIGRAPASINISGHSGSSGKGASEGGGISGVNLAKQNNPFSAPTGGTGTIQRVRDHSDMFRALSPALAGSGRIGGSTPRQPHPSKPGGNTRFPRGVRL